MPDQEPQSTKYPWYVRLIFWFQTQKYGHVLNSALVWAKSPKVFLALSWLYKTLERKNSPITPILRSLIIVRVSQLNGCSFCIDLNTSILIKNGVDLNKIELLQNWQNSNLFNEQEKLALEYTEAVTDSTKVISDNLKKRMNVRFNQEELVEITALIAFQNMSTKFNNAFGIEPQGFCAPKLKSGKL